MTNPTPSSQPSAPAATTSPGNAAPAPTPSPAAVAASGHTPRPRPTPGTRPSPAELKKRVTPAAQAGAGAEHHVGVAKPSAVVAQLVSSAAEHGRASGSGEIFLVTPAGERLVGQWQAGTPEEGLEYYCARFTDLATQAGVLEARLHTHPEEAVRIERDATALSATVRDAAAVGDLEALASHLESIAAEARQVQAEVAEQRTHQRQQAIAAKEALIAEAEQLAESSTQWKAAGARFHSILDEWKAIKGLDKTTDDGLWARFRTARDTFNRRRGAHFSELDKQRAQSRRLKEDLIARAEALQNSTDWAETSRAYRELMSEWKAAGRAGAKVDDQLWDRFRAAQDVFYQARKQEDAKKDQELGANAQAKAALLEEYGPKIDPDASVERARAVLGELQEKWDAIGFVPREQLGTLEARIRELEDRVSQAEEAQWRRTDPELQARLEQFRSRAQRLTAEAEAAARKGKTREAEKLAEQAAQWTEWAKAAEAAAEH